MGSFANYLENKLLDHIVGKTSYTMPTAYVGLSTADPTDDASGLAEPSSGSYARASTAGGDWDASSGGAILNANAITFPQATGSWGTLTHFALFDASSSGNMLAHGSLASGRLIENGDTFLFAATDLLMTLD